MQWKRSTVGGLFFLGGIFFLAGCTTQPSTQAPIPFEGSTLRIACASEAAANVMREYGRLWAARRAAKLEIVTADLDPARPPAADIILVEPMKLPSWTQAGQIQPLPENFRDGDFFDWVDLLTHYREQLLLWDRKPVAVPILGEAPLFFYRADLLADPKAQGAFKAKHMRALVAPETWEDLADLAEFYQGNLGPPLPPLPTRDDDLDREFFTLAACYVRGAIPPDVPSNTGQQHEGFSFHRDVTTGAERLTTPGFVHALEAFKRLQGCRPAGPVNSPPEAFADGKAVFCLASADWIPRFHKSKAIQQRFAIYPMPGSKFYFDFTTGDRRETPAGNRMPYVGAGGWLAAVLQSSSRSAAAFDLLAELSGPVLSRRIVVEPRWGGGATRRDHLKGSQVRWDSFQLNPAGTRALKDALDQTLLHPRLKNPVVKLRTPDATERQALLMNEVRQALVGKATPAEALAKAAQNWAKLDKAKGPAALEEYRMSVGLLAK